MIITNRLTIRKEHIDDAAGIQALLMEPDGRIFTGGVKSKTIEEIESAIRKNLDSFSLDMNEVKTGKKNCIFNVERNDSREYIGYCGFKYCEVIKDVEIFYGYLKQNWNMGFGKEAAHAVLDFGFSKTNMEELFAAVNPKNVASENILKAIGMIFRKQIEWPNQGWVNLYSLNREEYQKESKRRA